MSTLSDTSDALRDLEAYLVASPQGSLNPIAVDEQVRAVLRLLSREEPRWIGITKAKRLLGVEPEKTVKAWARLGLLRSRTLPSGRLQVRLDDVLYRRAEREGLMAIGGEEMTPEELRILYASHPGTNPWERERAEPSS